MTKLRYTRPHARPAVSRYFRPARRAITGKLPTWIIVGPAERRGSLCERRDLFDLPAPIDVPAWHWRQRALFTFQTLQRFLRLCLVATIWELGQVLSPVLACLVQVRKMALENAPQFKAQDFCSSRTPGG